MRNGGKLVSTFNDTHPDEISSVQFFTGKANKLLSSSIDGMVCQFDLKNESEEEATDSVIILPQAMNVCRYFEEEEGAAYALTTANTIAIISLAEAKLLKEHNTITDYETNEYALIDAYTRAKDSSVYYFSANLSGLVEEYAYNLIDEIRPLKQINKYFTKHQGPIRMTKKITDEVILTCGEDGSYQLNSRMAPPNNFDIEAQIKDMFIVEENNNKGLFLRKYEKLGNREEIDSILSNLSNVK